MIPLALELLTSPKTPQELAQGLGLSLEATLLLLKQLERKGYVAPLACGTACKVCAFRGFCGGPGPSHWVRQDSLP